MKKNFFFLFSKTRNSSINILLGMLVKCFNWHYETWNLHYLQILDFNWNSFRCMKSSTFFSCLLFYSTTESNIIWMDANFENEFCCEISFNSIFSIKYSSLIQCNVIVQCNLEALSLYPHVIKQIKWKCYVSYRFIINSTAVNGVNEMVVGMIWFNTCTETMDSIHSIE